MTYYAAGSMPALSSASSGMGVGSTALMIGGLISGAIGSYYSAKNQKIQLEGQAKLADINARIAELGAQQELIRGEKEVGQISMQAGRLKSAQRVALAANGVDLGQGNAAELQASTDLMKEIDMNTVKANAIRSAWGYRTQGTNAVNSAIARRATGAGISPGGQAFTTLLGSAGQVAGSWYQMTKAER